ncbi:hypothetical protein F4827_006920 [Paraburkholderia bannensis]|uniref:Uncharacterized protein n=1 Tax=Paraburkholderia bannensis TaxID=765414 RepID=A0A7W9WV35_9BURK|nr:hypothetical protein [Paraburkholderia sp. WP4_3_2]MBB6107040.1 hypothetical protein [Paraburkholderia bannensis]
MLRSHRYDFVKQIEFERDELEILREMAALAGTPQ